MLFGKQTSQDRLILGITWGGFGVSILGEKKIGTSVLRKQFSASYPNRETNTPPPPVRTLELSGGWKGSLGPTSPQSSVPPTSKASHKL